ncbi:hypothetical protein Pan44_26950 [Caulifigura coniformis]|uniref:Uncharacterized protein n=1 Tax=Caulifigura coniformis TaxID=2527983 RepID=A0A517SEZ6_9PLAN|nr:hypothetical protein [Caulifigura coniformis]QDT54660.1 hypothetical protein Pan44_26950 [Caulifigura coniformis]
MNRTSMDARLKKLEVELPAHAPAPPVMLLPDNGSSDEPPEEIRRRWEEFLRTGKSDRPVVTYPADVDIYRHGDGPTVVVVEDEEWYGNDAFQKQREREATAPADDKGTEQA